MIFINRMNVLLYVYRIPESNHNTMPWMGVRYNIKINQKNDKNTLKLPTAKSYTNHTIHIYKPNY